MSFKTIAIFPNVVFIPVLQTRQWPSPPAPRPPPPSSPASPSSAWPPLSPDSLTRRRQDRKRSTSVYGRWGLSRPFICFQLNSRTHPCYPGLLHFHNVFSVLKNVLHTYMPLCYLLGLFEDVKMIERYKVFKGCEADIPEDPKT